MLKILLVLMLAPAQANQAANGVIRGQVLIPSVYASERILVVARKSDGPIVGGVCTDSIGNYEVRSLVAGNYDVVVNVEGYEEVRQQVGVGGGFFNVATLNIPLRAKDNAIVIRPDRDPAENTVDV